MRTTSFTRGSAAGRRRAPRPGWPRRRGAPVVTVLLAGCGLVGGAGTVTPSSTEVPGIVGRDCRFANPPDRTPPLGDLTRVGLRGNISLWGQALDAGDSVEVSVRYASDGELLWVQAIRSNLPDDKVASLESLLLGALDQRAEPDWGVRILVVGSEVARVEPSVICPPSPRLGPVIRPTITDQRTMEEFRLVQGRRYPVQIGLDERGNVLSVRLVRRSGSTAVDDYMLEFIWRSQFDPKLHDGIGLPSVYETDVEFPRWRR